MNTLALALVGLAVALSPIVSYAQESEVQTSEQTTLSGDLANNPLAQDILRKIEQTKKWIADLEQRNYERIQAQQLLEEKRAIALERLNEDLKEWEALWSNYTSRAAFERFVDDKPSDVQPVFWDAFEFKEMKVNAGREALKKVIANGGSLKEAREAYLKAAETKRIELIEQNSIFNVRHNLAYYQEQLLFDKEGEFILTDESQDTLGEFYSDYKTNPAYLAANPDDEYASKAIDTDADTQCREGYVVIYRFQQRDYACVTEFSAKQWIRYGIGEIPGIADLMEDIQVQSSETNIDAKIEIINQQIRKYDAEYKSKLNDLIDWYDAEYHKAETEFKKAEKNVIANYNSNKTMTAKEFTAQILSVRNTVESQKDKLLEDKLTGIDDLKAEFDDNIKKLQSSVQNIGIKIVWDSELSNYQVIKE